ncbi:YihY/virulence factor BrkB family protein [Arthrobacter cryoconiti]|uniref:YihY/virulence factor BrkB family protein n=1 Tax=Arthrobacter cryoconiti TaxID=748907 RepID=A0ABV8R2Y0_9MICC|nr:YihY/virulence factor BrkB family protein [Arthrobacter cryoconiti]MCC9067048.1 YihY/virulence factor BrkB family protein [Arthrobacter cryoconiti]
MSSQVKIGTAVDHAGAPSPHDSRKPQNPIKLPANSWKYIAKRALSKFSTDGCTDLAAALTYYGVLSLFPAILALVSIVGLLGQKEETTKVMLDLIGQLGGTKVSEAVAEPVKALAGSSAAGWAFALGLLTALWSASGYVGAFSRAMNRVYGTDEGRPVWKLRPTLLLVTLGAVLLVAAIALMLVISGPLARVIGNVLGVGDAAVIVWNTAKWPVVAILAIALIAVLYYFTPNVRQPKFRWISIGASVALIAMVLASIGFFFYVANFSKYNKTYGSIAGVIVLLLWIWILNLMLLLGAQVDAELERGRQLQAGIKAESQLMLPPRDTTASAKKREKHMLLVAQGKSMRRRAALEAGLGSGLEATAEKRVLWWTVAAGATMVLVSAIRRRRIANTDKP